MFLVPNLDRISQYPGFVHDDLHWDQFVAQFNTTLSEELDALEETIDATILRVDWLQLSDEIIADPARYGLSNVTDPAGGAQRQFLLLAIVEQPIEVRGLHEIVVIERKIETNLLGSVDLSLQVG